MENDSNLGFATAVNQGIRAASGQYILLLNPDARLNPGALRALVGFLDSHPSAAAVGPRITGANGALVRSCRVFPSLAVILARDTGLSDRFPRHPVFGAPTLSFWGYDSDRQVDYASGACLLLRRQAIEAVGLLDEGYFMYGEEMDLCWRLWRRGWAVWFTPSASIQHTGGRSAAKVQQPHGREPLLLRSYYYSQARFLVKNRSVALYVIWWILVFSKSVAASAAYLLAAAFSAPELRGLRLRSARRTIYVARLLLGLGPGAARASPPVAPDRAAETLR